MIKGITIENNETKLLQYADDTTVVLWDISSTLFRLLNDFEKITGLAVNPTKTEGLWIGSLRENKLTPFGIIWTNEPVKALGVYYSYDQKLLDERSLAVWKDNCNKILDYSKVCLHSVIIIHPQKGDPRIK